MVFAAGTEECIFCSRFFLPKNKAMEKQQILTAWKIRLEIPVLSLLKSKELKTFIG